MLQPERNLLDAVRRDPKVRNLYKFLERGLQRAVKPGTLQTVPANTGERTVEGSTSELALFAKVTHVGRHGRAPG